MSWCCNPSPPWPFALKRPLAHIITEELEVECIVIYAGDDRYRDLSDEAGPQEVLRSRMPKLKAAKGSVFTIRRTTIQQI